METRSLLRQIMGYSLPFGFLILFAVAANGDEQGGENPVIHPPDTSTALSSAHPTVAANKSSQNATTSETIHAAEEIKVYSAALEPPSEESIAAAKRPSNATISTTKSSPSEKSGAKPGQATTPATAGGSGGLTASLVINMALVLSPALLLTLI